jgi:hypothetical protein
VMEKLLEDQKAGKVDVDIQRPRKRQEPAVIVATYKTGPKKEIYYIDQPTNLITRIEFYRIEDVNQILRTITEFSDYNVPINEKMFSLKDELPSDVSVADQLHQLIGVPQGDMNDEQAAAETVRQFFQALVNKDYKKAGLIYGGTLEKYAKQEFGDVNVMAIVSIGPAIHQPDWEKRGYKVPCELEIINSDGQKVTWKPGAYVRPGDDELHPDRWTITGGVSTPADEDGEFYVRLFNANAAKRFVITGFCNSKLQPLHEINWSNEPNVLPDNDVCAKMSPEDVVKAFNESFSKENWDEMRKFLPDYFVDGLKHDIEIWKKQVGFKEGQPFCEVLGKAFWSAEQSAYFVKCRQWVQEERQVESGGEQQRRADNEKYQKMTPKEVAEAFFKACAEEKPDKFRKFWPQSAAEQAEQVWEYSFGLKVISIGEPFKKGDYPGWFVPYEVRLKDGRVEKNNLSVRNDNPLQRWIVDGGI